jgi:MOSC domain-containing protein YiiM
MSKPIVSEIKLLEGLGVEGDAHAGKTVQHLSRIKKDPSVPNYRQVHLMHSEVFDELARQGFSVSAGQMGENITCRNIPLLQLPKGTRLIFEQGPIVELTGLRNPCYQLDNLQNGLMKALLDRDDKGKLIRKAGVMAVVIKGGLVAASDTIIVQLPKEPHEKLEKI